MFSLITGPVWGPAVVGLPGALHKLDTFAADAADALAFDAATAAMLVLTDLGGINETTVLVLLLGAGFAAFRQWRSLLALALTSALTLLAVFELKGLFERARPSSSDALMEAAGYSFPSGHAAKAAALYGIVAILAAVYLRDRRRFRAVAIGLSVAVILIVGVSRVYLGVHYPTDVIAGWLLGGGIALAAWRLSGLAFARPSPAGA